MASSSQKAAYTDRGSRITKENLFMALALWMERYPLNDPQLAPFRKVGAVLALPNDILHAVDCSRNGVHAVARLLIKHHDMPKDCKVFVSRKPCSFCTKLLVQSKVKRVFYLPIEPEYLQDKENQEKLEKSKGGVKVDMKDDKAGLLNGLEDDRQDEENQEKSVKSKDAMSCVDMKDGVQDGLKKAKNSEMSEKFKEEMMCVDNLFKVSEIGQTTFVPKVEKEVLEASEQKKKTETPKEILANIEGELEQSFWNEKWMAQAKTNLPWPAFDDKMKGQVRVDFTSLLKWMAQAFVGSEKGYEFKATNQNGTPNEVWFDPERNANTDGKLASHFITMARLLAERTDEPTQGVGAVIINKDKDIVALGWNGFPSKALYGEFARASRHDKGVKDKKYPYSIHAEQNALLNRNTKDIVDGTLFVTKTPCDECTPLLEMQGIKTVVISGKLQKEQRPDLSYSKFSEKVESGVFICFETKPKDGRPAPSTERSRNLKDMK